MTLGNAAATVIQQYYRGHRTRRQVADMKLEMLMKNANGCIPEGVHLLLEKLDPIHRHGRNLVNAYKRWRRHEEPFFHCITVGEGRTSVDRSRRVRYLNKEQRKPYEVNIVNGKWFHKHNMELLDTMSDNWLFVMSPSNVIYVAPRSERFHHSSFLAGENVAGAGMLKLEHGVLKLITSHSGHYHYQLPDHLPPKFLEVLEDKGLCTSEVMECYNPSNI